MLRSKNGGLTVLEVVVILVIIVVIAAVLFPVVAHRGSPTRKSECFYNLKECAIALQTYWTDYDNTLPSSALVSGSKRWNRKDFLIFATLASGCPAPEGAAKTWAQILYPHMKNKDIMFCPSDSVDKNDPESQVSYWWKLAIDKASYGEGCAKPCRVESDFKWSADQIVLYERCGFHHGRERAGLVNGAGIKVAYLDSHVRHVVITNATSGDPVNCAANSDGEPMYFNFDFKKPKNAANPPPPDVPARFVDPSRYGDILP